MLDLTNKPASDWYKELLARAMLATDSLADAVRVADEAWRMQPEVSARFTLDKSGHEHKGKGEGGGQFVSVRNGDSKPQPSSQGFRKITEIPISKKPYEFGYDPREQDDVRKKARYDESIPISYLDPKNLVATQNDISDERRNRIQGDIREPIFVVKYDGRFYIEEGHHRALSAMRDGKRVPARVVELLDNGNSYRGIEIADKASLSIPASTQAAFAHDIENRQAQGVLNKAMASASKLRGQARKEFIAALNQRNRSQQAVDIINLVERYRLQMAELLTQTQLAALLAGMKEVASKLPVIPPPGAAPPPPPTLEPKDAAEMVERFAAMDFAERDAAIYRLPPDQQEWIRQAIPAEQNKPPVPPSFRVATAGAGQPDDYHFPVIDEAVELLATKNVMRKEDYVRLDAASRERAFTVAGVDAQETLTKILDSLSENIAEGADYETWRKKMEAEGLDGTFLSESHAETVFRNGVQAAFSDGQMKVLSHPFVRSGFPYMRYAAIVDDRTREEHKHMDAAGIGGSSIYRIDDPVAQKFLPPWAFNCVPADSLISTGKGRIRIDRVKKGDKVLTHLGRFRTVTGTHTTESVPELVAVELESGSFSRATGEHRFFTQRGWVEASALHISDQVYEIVDSTAPYLVMLKIDDGFQAESFTNGQVSISVGPSRIMLNFDANGDGRKIEVKPKWKGLLVENKLYTSGRKCGGKCLFVTAHADYPVNVCEWIPPDSLPSSGDHLRTNFGTARGSMDAISGSNLLASFWAKPMADGSRLPNGSQSDSARYEESLYRSIGNPGNAGNVRDACFLVDVISDDAIRSSWPNGQTCLGVIQVGKQAFWLVTHAYNCSMVKTRIKSISTATWGNPVYNLSVEEDESYISDGLAVHNCRCSWFPMSIKAAADAGVGEAAEWLSSGKEPSPPAFVPMPAFQPPPGFRRQILPPSAALQLSLLPLDFQWQASFDDTFSASFAVNEVESPTSPGPGWTLVRTGVRGGKYWAAPEGTPAKQEEGKADASPATDNIADVFRKMAASGTYDKEAIPLKEMFGLARQRQPDLTVDKFKEVVRSHVAAGNLVMGSQPNSVKAGGSSPAVSFQTVSQADKWASENFTDWAPKLSPEEKWAVSAYIGGGYESINADLRQGKDPATTRGKTPQVISGLDQALAKGKAPSNLVGYRGVRGEFAEQLIELAQKKGEFTDNAYISTTLASDAVKSFARNKNVTNAVVKIRIPKGSKGGYVDEVAQDGGEGEWLLPRNSVVKVTSAKKNESGLWEIDAELSDKPSGSIALSLDFDESAVKRDHGKFATKNVKADAESDKPAQEQPKSIPEIHQQADKAADAIYEKHPGLLAKLKAPGVWLKNKTAAMKAKLEERYGKKTAWAIVGAGLVAGYGGKALLAAANPALGASVGVLVPSELAIAPFVALAELYRQGKRLSVGLSLEEEKELTPGEIMVHGKTLAVTVAKAWEEHMKANGIGENVSAAFAQVHAPHNMVLLGKSYRGGEFIPQDALDQLSDKEHKELLGSEHLRADDEGEIGAHVEAGKGDKGLTYAGDTAFPEKLNGYFAKHYEREFGHIVDAIENLIGQVGTDADPKTIAAKAGQARDYFEEQFINLAEHLSKTTLGHFKRQFGDHYGGSNEFYEAGDPDQYEADIEAAKDEAVEQTYELFNELIAHIEAGTTDDWEEDADDIYSALSDATEGVSGAFEAAAEGFMERARIAIEDDEAEDEQKLRELEDAHFDDITDEVVGELDDAATQEQINAAWTRTVKEYNAAFFDDTDEYRISIDDNGELEIVHADDLPDEYRPDAASLSLSAEFSNAEVESPTQPGPNYKLVRTGPKGGKYWRAGKSGKSAEAATSRSRPKQAEFSVKVKPTKKRAFTGQTVPIKDPISKQESGKIGEAIVIAWLKSMGFGDARHLNLDRNNFPIDLIQDHESIEAKTGLVSNGSGAQQWRLTIGEPGKKEKEWLKTASQEEKAAWNAQKQKMISERKTKCLAELSEKLGKPVKARTITVLLNPDTKTADLYQFDGWHNRIGWNSDEAKKAYKGSVTYAAE